MVIWYNIISSVIEIFILSVVIYYLWRLFQGTRGARVLTGMLIVFLGLFVITWIFRLEVLKVILSFLANFLPFVAVVIFHPELRQVLADLGTRSIRNSSHQTVETIEAIVDAIEILQREKFGALIAIERDFIYQPARSTGTLLNCKINPEILATIFYPKTPLHDGGVLIREDKIITAASIFPISQEEDIERTLGLRHRAALGLCHEIDAIVVVLSEETGILSIAEGNRLIRPITLQKLRSYLTENLL